MARKKKQNNEVSETVEISEEKFSFLHGDAKRSIVAVFLFAFSVLIVLSFFEAAGSLGVLLHRGVGMLVGWGKWVFPVLLITLGVMLLQRKHGLWSGIFKLLGPIFIFISLLGLFHLYAEGDMRQLVKEGSGGGFIGFLLAGSLLRFTGMVAGTVVLFSIFLIGLIMTFNLSLAHLFSQACTRLKSIKNREEDVDSDEYAQDGLEENADAYDPIELSEDIQDQSDIETKVLEEKNIKNIEFVENGSYHAMHASQGDESESDVEEEGGVVQNPVARVKKRKKKSSLKKWILPPLDLLEAKLTQAKAGNTNHNADTIQKTLKHFGIDVEFAGAQTGPTVTQYAFRPAVGVKLSRITALSNDLALALAAPSIRIEAPIPGKSLIGIEIPNQSFATVRMRDVLMSTPFVKRASSMFLALGQDVNGEYIVSDLHEMPHLLIAGATKTGKSVCINSLLLSLLYQNSPEDLKLILIDPKRVELSLYNKIPHLLTDVIVENKKVVNVLKWSVSEMERRYKLLQETGSRDINSYHEKCDHGEKRFVEDPETHEKVEESLERLPYIVIVIDEMADLMMAHGKDVEGLIVRISQMARAVGIHLIIATQRPSVEVLTGLIKANIVTRVAFQVATQIDSRTILDQSGAEKLLGRGDLLYVSAGASRPRRLQGVFVSEMEVKSVVDFLRKQRLDEDYEESLDDDISMSANDRKENNRFSPSISESSGGMDISADDNAHEDEHYVEARELVVQTGKASASLLQRKLRVGYARAARLLDMLEEDGIIGPADGAKAREVYVQGSMSHNAQDEESDDESVFREQEQRNKWQV